MKRPTPRTGASLAAQPSRRGPSVGLAPVALLLTVVAVWGCEHPIAIVSPHVEAADLILATPEGAEVARTEFNRQWSVPALELEDGVTLDLVLVALDFRGDPIDLTGRSDLSFRMEARDGTLVQWEPLSTVNRIHPFAVGETEVRFLIWHINHADFVTPWLRLRVHPPSNTSVPPDP